MAYMDDIMKNAMNEQRGRQLETNCLGFISSEKYKKELAELIEIAEIYKEIVFREKKEKDQKRKRENSN